MIILFGILTLVNAIVIDVFVYRSSGVGLGVFNVIYIIAFPLVMSIAAWLYKFNPVEDDLLDRFSSV